MAELTYDGVEYDYVTTREFLVESELDPSGTDEKFLKVSLTLQFAITSEGGNVHPGAGTAEEPAETFTRIKNSLMAPRKTLLFANNNKILINIDTVPDAMNGPIPQYCRPVMEHGFGPAVWVVEWNVICTLPGCRTGFRQSAFLTLRWSQTHDVDERGYSTLITSGRGMMNPAILRGASPDTYRDALVPPLLFSFERKSNYTVSENGLEFTFTFTDQEKTYAPPLAGLNAFPNDNDPTYGRFPFVRIRGRCSLTTATGALFYATISSEVIGKKGAAKSSLVKRAMMVVADKITEIGLLKSNEGKWTVQLLVEAEMDTDIARVMFRAKAQRVIPVPKNDTPVAININKLTDDLSEKLSTPKSMAQFQTTLDVGSRGFANLKIIVAALGDPCSSNLQKPTWGVVPGVGGAPRTVANGGSTATFRLVPIIPPLILAPQILPEIKGWGGDTGMTEVVVIKTDYKRIRGITPLPLTSTQDNGKTVALVQLNDPVMTKTFNYTIEKVGKPPVVPDLKSTDSNLVLLDDFHSPDVRDEEADGTKKYIITGNATYIVLNPKECKIAYPLPPWRDYDDEINKTDLNVFAPNRIVGIDKIDPAFNASGGSLFPELG